MLNFILIYRNLTKIKEYTFLNIAGLGIGLACSLAMLVWLRNELSYDRHLPDANRIYRLTFETNNSGNRIHFARCNEDWIPKIPGFFPEIEEMIRLAPFRHTAIKAEENKFYSDNVFATDSNFFKVFNIRLKSGNPEKVLKEPHSAVISSSLAQKCFGSLDPVGQSLLLSGEYDTKMTLFSISGVMNDTPMNSHIHFDIITSFEKPDENPDWSYVYLLLRPNSGPNQILQQFPAFLREAAKELDQGKYIPDLQRITDIHLYSDKDREVEPNGSITGIYLFILITLVVLIISWSNFYNLNRARMLALQKQIHLQLITGSTRALLTLQSLAESAIITLLSFGAALFLLDLADGYSVRLLGFRLLPDGLASLTDSWVFILGILSITILAGSFPLINYLRKSDKPLLQFRGFLNRSWIGISSYRILLTGQFILAILLMTASIAINRQKNYMLSLGLGEMSPDILVFKKQNWEIRFKYDIFRKKALESPLVKAISAAMEEPSGETLDALGIESGEIGKGNDDTRLFVLAVEDNFLDFFNIPLVAGSNFTRFNPERKGEDYILNETAVKRLGWTPQEAIGKPFKVKFDVPDIFYGGTVTGVVRDFNFNTARQEIKPYVLFQKPIFYLCFLVKIDHPRKNEAISYLKKIWEAELPDYPFQYEFINDTYRSAYASDLSQGKLTGLFSILSILIICFGLLSVTSLLVEQRTREIGIRKTNGARFADILIALNSDFIRCFAVALIIAYPAGWYFMNKWLQNFVYRTHLSWWIFILSGLPVLILTILTVSLQSWRAAKRNPVEALRYE
ncbi:MAG: ABC transporter permease [Bacteroidota bacterium]|nr:ABC transporter permease [Bacteroidota bacterium]